MKTEIKKENYSCPTVDVRALEFAGFLCTSTVNFTMYVDEYEIMRETDIDVYAY